MAGVALAGALIFGCSKGDGPGPQFGSAGLTAAQPGVASEDAEDESSGPDPSAEATDSGTVPDESSGTGTTGPLEPELPDAACDIYMQDCPTGEKCTLWADDGSGTPNALRCAPVTDNKQYGDQCFVDAIASGLDDCALGLYCQVDDPTVDTVGHCAVFCKGASGMSDCENPDDACGLLYGGVAPFCLPACDPEKDACPEGESCREQLIGPTVCVGDGWGA